MSLSPCHQGCGIIVSTAHSPREGVKGSQARPLLARVSAAQGVGSGCGHSGLSAHFQLGQKLAALCFCFMAQSEGSRPSVSKRVEALVSVGGALRDRALNTLD